MSALFCVQNYIILMKEVIDLPLNSDDEIRYGNPVYASENHLPSLSIKQIVQLIQKQSIGCIWEQSMRCPCVDITTSQPKTSCKICHGQGFIYLHPTYIDMAMQSDNKKFDISVNGYNNSGTTVATPQITVNQYEQGIKPGDRITVPGWTTTENYVININQERLVDGVFLPYKTRSVNEAYYMKDDKLVSLNADDIELNDNYLRINNKQLLNQTITLSLEIVKRFYVVSLEKELRYQSYYNLHDKLWALGNGTGQISGESSETGTDDTRGNEYMDDFKNPPRNLDTSPNYLFPQVVNRDGKLIVMGKHQIYRLPPKLILRRENLYFSNINLVDKNVDSKSAIKDPRVTEFDSFIGE